jgi:4-azaleucine resistance transporter AzlC
MLDKYRDTGKYKPYLEFALTDETFSIVCDGAPEGLDAPGYYFLLSLFNQSYWVLGTILGICFQKLVDIPFYGVEF